VNVSPEKFKGFEMIDAKYSQAVKALMALAAIANAADSSEAAVWQRPEDANQKGFYGHIVNAIKAIGGENIYKGWLETGELPSWVQDEVI
jgi:hypothetical protein